MKASLLSLLFLSVHQLFATEYCRKITTWKNSHQISQVYAPLVAVKKDGDEAQQSYFPVLLHDGNLQLQTLDGTVCERFGVFRDIKQLYPIRKESNFAFFILSEQQAMNIEVKSIIRNPKKNTEVLLQELKMKENEAQHARRTEYLAYSIIGSVTLTICASFWRIVSKFTK